MKSMPKDSLVIEIAPHSLLQGLIKRTFGPDCVYASLMKKNSPDNVMHFFENLGNMYINGCDMRPLSIFPEVKFPVPQKTPLISPMISKQWNHTEVFRIPHINDISGNGSDASETVFDLTEDGDARYLFGHGLNGVKLFPGSGYLYLAWEALAAQHGTTFDKLPVIMENVSIFRATTLPENGKLTFTCRLLRTGEFEVTENNELVATGKICLASEAPKIKNEMKELDEKISSQRNSKKADFPLTRDELYLVMLMKGLEYGGPFRGMASTDRQVANIDFKGQWVAFLDCFLQFAVFSQKSEKHVVPFAFDALYLDASHIVEQQQAGVETPVSQMRFDLDMDYGTSEVFKFMGFGLVDTQHSPSGNPLLEEVRFVPYLANIPVATDKSLSQYATDCIQYTVHGLKNALKSGNFPLLSGNKDVVSDALKEFRFTAAMSSDEDLSQACQLPNSGLAKTLKKIFPPAGTSTDPGAVNEILTSNKEELSRDRLIDNLSSTDILDAALEIVKYNFPDGKHTVLEVDAASSRIHIVPRLQVRSGINYTATDKDDLPKDFKGPGMKAVTWDPASGGSSPSVEATLLVLKNVLHKQANVVSAFTDLANNVVPGGFILVQEVTHNFPLFVALEGLHQNVTLPTTNGTREYGRFMTDR
ncbi:fatty acid synthase [Aplysia californica]|uniref:Fatty acid synthase n=1 Tax=Aplysia californica TaxID=6500 RepID=A0ABM1VSE2_APLCA|nr:fatty acid synthase [Aplysia californica]